MDPVTQFALGAVAAQAVFGKKLGHRAWLIGGAAGAAPDLDIFFKSATDPLFQIEMHRQFTHSLAFIPVGGALAALPWLAAKKARALWRPVLGASILGWATHGLLDACTTYGTQLLWPFSTLRVSWDNVAIVDPLVTLALLVGVVWAARARSNTPARAALAATLAYLGFGVVQHARALDAQAAIAASRGHVIERGAAFPAIGSNLVWRSLYRVGDTYHADRIRVSWLGATSWQAGTTMAAVNPAAFARAPDRIRRDYARFAHFSDQWVAPDPARPGVYADARYSRSSTAFAPIWGVHFEPTAATPTQWVDRSVRRELSFATLWREWTGRAPGFAGLPTHPLAAPLPEAR
jgi:inner membrane protein